jgi:hypothetical protein
VVTMGPEISLLHAESHLPVAQMLLIKLPTSDHNAQRQFTWCGIDGIVQVVQLIAIFAGKDHAHLAYLPQLPVALCRLDHAPAYQSL